MAQRSEDSAARFLKLRARRIANVAGTASRLKAGRRKAEKDREAARIERLMAGDCWQHVRAHVAQAITAWFRDVGTNPDDFVLGTTGRPETAVAIDKRCFDPTYTGCRCHQFRRGRWVPSCHPPIITKLVESKEEAYEDARSHDHGQVAGP